MDIPELHPWPKNQNEAVEIQHRLKSQVITGGTLDDVRLIAGVDTAFDHNADLLYAGVSLYKYPEMIECDRVTASAKAIFPYVAGLYAFREGPVMLKALSRLRLRPDLIIFAAHGIAHPNKFGVASHLGLILDLPTIGCARKKLVGQHDEIGQERDESTPLILDNREVGVVYRTREKVKPVFISPGHKCDIKNAVDMVVNCLNDYRIPEPLRAAHRHANRAKRNNKKPSSVRNI